MENDDEKPRNGAEDKPGDPAEQLEAARWLLDLCIEHLECECEREDGGGIYVSPHCQVAVFIHELRGDCACDLATEAQDQGLLGE